MKRWKDGKMKRWKDGKIWKRIWRYVLLIVLWLLAVVRYDMVAEMVGHPWRVFQVVQHGRSGRYEAVSYDDGLRRDKIFLRSQQELTLGDVVRVRDRFYERKYSPEWCFWICDHGKLSDGQSRQVVDNSDLGLIKFDYHRWMYMKWIQGNIYDDYTQLVRQEPSGLHTIRNKLREIVMTMSESINKQALWLGMTIGDRSLFDEDIYQWFVDSGLVHIVAVSGAHVSIVILLVSILLFWMPFYVRQVIILCAIIWYTILVGDHSSVVRAAIMGILTVIALFPGRQIDIRRSMAIAWVLMLARNPYLLIADLWFALSFGALSGIVRIVRKREIIMPRVLGEEFVSLVHTSTLRKSSRQTRWKYRLQWWEYLLRLYVIPSLGAMIWVIPILMIVMGKVNLIWPIANIVVLPMVTGARMLGLILMGLWVMGSGLWVEGIIDMMVWLLEGMLWYIIWWADWAQKYAVWMVWR